MSEIRYTIDPSNFSESQWEEIYNASTIMPRTYERRDTAKPFKRPRKYIRLAIECLRNKADNVLNGGLGVEPHAGDDETWACDLNSAADILSDLIGEPHMTRRAARDRLYDLLNSDIYTDAREYRDRVREVQRLIPVVFGRRS